MSNLGVIVFGIISSMFSLVLFIISFIAAANKERPKDYAVCICSLITFIFAANMMLG